MADDSAERTEEPTSRKLQRSREEGQVARSVELTSAAVMTGWVICLVATGGFWVHQVTTKFAAGFKFDRKVLDSPSLLPATFAGQILDGLLLMLPMMLVAVTLAVLASGAIGGFLFSIKSIAPKFSKLSP